MLPPTMEEVQSATDTRSGSMPAWRAKLKQMADMKKGGPHQHPDRPQWRTRRKTTDPEASLPPTGVEQMFRHFFSVPFSWAKPKRNVATIKLKNRGTGKRATTPPGGQTACCGAQQKGKAERDQANVDVQPGPQD